MKKSTERFNVSGFEDERKEPRTMECAWPLEAQRAAMNHPLETPVRNIACSHLEFTSIRSVADF